MHITVTRARAAHLEACAAVFDNSPLHERYFTEPGRLERMLTSAIGRGELWMAACASGEVVGVMWVDLDGFFGGFPYLALLGVRNGIAETAWGIRCCASMRAWQRRLATGRSL